MAGWSIKDAVNFNWSKQADFWFAKAVISNHFYGHRLIRLPEG